VALKCDFLKVLRIISKTRKIHTMKTRKITELIFFAILFLIGKWLMGQNQTSQFEKTQDEIVKLINLPNLTFNPNLLIR
jgi:ABC-type nickel/cobalt efflux system permease component RcnA